MTRRHLGLSLFCLSVALHCAQSIAPEDADQACIPVPSGEEIFLLNSQFYQGLISNNVWSVEDRDGSSTNTWTESTAMCNSSVSYTYSSGLNQDRLTTQAIDVADLSNFTFFISIVASSNASVSTNFMSISFSNSLFTFTLNGNVELTTMVTFSSPTTSVTFTPNLSVGESVTIDSFRFYLLSTCRTTVLMYAKFPAKTNGTESIGTCVPNAQPASVSVTANCDGSTSPPIFMTTNACECRAGYEGNAKNTICTACSVGMFKTGAGPDMCQSCPAQSTATSSGSTSCACTAGHARPPSADLSADCEPCEVNMFKMDSGNGTCQSCPPRSETPSTGSTSCSCKLGYANDSAPDCDMCSANYYMSAGTCSLCPPGTVPNAEGNNAFSCACAENYTRLNGAPNSACSRCPDNSTRSSGNSSCSCILDFYPVTPTMMMPCQAVVGFTVQSVGIKENEMVNLMINLTYPVTTDVKISHSPTDGINIAGDLFGTNIIRFDSSKSKSITVSIRNNEVALESRQYIFSLDRNMAVDDKSTEVYYGDYAGLFGMLLLNVTDNDVLTVEFVDREIKVMRNEGVIRLKVKRLLPIANSLSVTVNRPGGLSQTKTFNPGASDTLDFLFNITDDLVTGQQYTFSLVANDAVGPVVYGADGTVNVTIMDEPESAPAGFPLGAIIGIAAGGAALAVLVVLVCLVCVCFFRLRVNRQGFYETNEDKTNEPPSMLRYSASLRSISSQTVVPTDGRAGSKENEFYV